MKFLEYTIIAISIYYIALVISRSWRFLNRVSDFSLISGPLPKDLTVSLLCPCKGGDKDNKRLTININSLLKQTRVRYEVIFVVEEKKDPAYRTIKQKISTFSHARLFVAKKKQGKEYSGKINNMIAGFEKIKRNTDLVVFADSGCQYPRNWLFLLIKTFLSQPETTASMPKTTRRRRRLLPRRVSLKASPWPPTWPVGVSTSSWEELMKPPRMESRPLKVPRLVLKRKSAETTPAGAGKWMKTENRLSGKNAIIPSRRLLDKVHL